MSGRIIAVGFVVVALVAAGAMYYLQVFAYYDRLPPQETFALTPEGEDAPRSVAIAGFRGIDSDSSPLRYRACFTLEAAADTFETYPGAGPLNAPYWFGCFDAEAIGAALESGAATAYLSERNVEYGFDRVVAVFPDGRAYAWPQINDCGEAFFDGLPLPPHCPLPPEES